MSNASASMVGGPPSPPTDPRLAWGLPERGQLPSVEAVDDLTVRVTAPNAGPMTLDGTNTYIVGRPGHDAVIVDPGPEASDHLDVVAKVITARDLTVSAVFVTHRHLDHTEAALPWAGHFGCKVVGGLRRSIGPAGRLVGDRDTIDVAGSEPFQVVATPGHVDDHLALRLPTGSLVVGDHILGRGTAVISSDSGDLPAYLDSLRKVHELGPDALLPGHGPVLREDPTAVVDYYLAHRAYRMDQVVWDLRTHGDATVEQLLDRLYPDVSERLRIPARASLQHALTVLQEQQVVTIVAGGDGDQQTVSPLL